MTYAWGMRCTDGVVLVADSMHIYWQDNPLDMVDGRDYWFRFDNKIHRLGERSAFVATGSFTDEIRVGKADQAETFDELTRRVFQEVGSLLGQANDLTGADYGVLVAGIDGEPTLSRMATEKDRAAEGLPSARPGWRVGVGQVLTSGGVMRWPSIEHPMESWRFPVLDVIDGRRVGLACAYAYLDEVYRRNGYESRDAWPGMRGEKDGAFPVFSYPLNVMTITANGITDERVEEPTPEQGDKLLSLLGLPRAPLGEPAR